MSSDADEVARARWREMEARRNREIAVSAYFHVSRVVAAHWCDLAWESDHARQAADREEANL